MVLRRVGWQIFADVSNDRRSSSSDSSTCGHSILHRKTVVKTSNLVPNVLFFSGTHSYYLSMHPALQIFLSVLRQILESAPQKCTMSHAKRRPPICTKIYVSWDDPEEVWNDRLRTRKDVGFHAKYLSP